MHANKRLTYPPAYSPTTVPATILQHFMFKASYTSVHAEANAHSPDWLMRIFMNELAPPHARSQQVCTAVPKNFGIYCKYNICDPTRVNEAGVGRGQF